MKGKKQFESADIAIEYLKSKGDLTYFGHGNGYRVYTLRLRDGSLYRLFVNDDGWVEVIG